MERNLLAPIAEMGHRVDTSTLTPVQLRGWIHDLLVTDTSRLVLSLESFGFKGGVPLDADFVFDARFLPNPHYDPRLRPLTGRDPEVVAFLEGETEAGLLLEDIHRFIERWLPRFTLDRRAALTVAIGCTGGRHRSVYLVERLAERLRPHHPHSAPPRPRARLGDALARKESPLRGRGRRTVSHFRSRRFLYPGMRLPLSIFEPRYMTWPGVHQARFGFGVCLIARARGGHARLGAVGCSRASPNGTWETRRPEGEGRGASASGCSRRDDGAGLFLGDTSASHRSAGAVAGLAQSADFCAGVEAVGSRVSRSPFASRCVLGGGFRLAEIPAVSQHREENCGAHRPRRPLAICTAY